MTNTIEGEALRAKIAETLAGLDGVQGDFVVLDTASPFGIRTQMQTRLTPDFIRDLCTLALSALDAPEPVVKVRELEWRDLPSATVIVARLREIFQNGMDKVPGYQTDKEIYGMMHGQVMQLLNCDPAEAARAALATQNGD